MPRACPPEGTKKYAMSDPVLFVRQTSTPGALVGSTIFPRFMQELSVAGQYVPSTWARSIFVRARERGVPALQRVPPAN